MCTLATEPGRMIQVTADVCIWDDGGPLICPLATEPGTMLQVTADVCILYMCMGW